MMMLSSLNCLVNQQSTVGLILKLRDNTYKEPTLCDWGHGIHFPFIRDLVSNYLNTNKIPNRFKNNTPGKDWFYHFLNRWKHKIGTRYAKNMSSARANSCTSETIERFFEMLSSHKLNEVDPKNLWNVDESGFSCDPGRKKSYLP